MPLPLLPILGVAALLYFATKGDDSKQPEPSDPGPGSDGDNASGQGSETPATGGIDDPEQAPDEEKTRTNKYPAFTTAYAKTPYREMIASTENQYGIPEDLLARLLYEESNFRPDVTHANNNGTTDIGIAQINSAYIPDGVDPLQPDQAIDYAGKYLSSLANQFGDWRTACVAYNWGPTNVKNFGVDAAPPKTLAYADGMISDSEA